MLHLIPDSSLRRWLLRVVVLQRRLVRALCAFPVNTSVDQAWLCEVWKCLDTDWVRRFWENDKGNRAAWINRVAAATPEEKQGIWAIAKEQLQFRDLWAAAPSVRMRRANWKQEPFRSLNGLLKSFYDPLFYSREGYAFKNVKFHKEDFLDGIPANRRKVCPYCDNYLQTTELDHFLPKDDFPFLSCHPDNLIPSCHDSNRGSHKGTKVPLDWDQEDQAGGWFHPRWRSGNGRIGVEVAETPERALSARLVPISHVDTPRVANLENMFLISDFWSRQIEDELQLIGSQVSDLLREEKVDPTEQAVRGKLLSIADITKLSIGKRGLAMCHHALYQFAANNPAVVSDITRECRGIG